MTNADLDLQRIRDGDIDAFERLFRTLHAPLCEVVDSYVRSQAVAEDIVQDLFFVFWMRRQVVVATSLRAYLFTAARNRALHHLRHQSFVSRLSRLIDARPEIAGVARSRTSAATHAESNEQREAIRRAVNALPPRTRLAFVLRFEHEMSNAEVAEAMGVTVKGVEKLLFVANRKLRDQLGRFADHAQTQS